ncbi:hypothetical protein ACIRP0_21835 [Streptomyces sp. NPDC101733]|uniref:hypothetical protein n=1 Tax=unclassified Streptomyces TaxID=2593676 RepID=UPI003810B0C5
MARPSDWSALGLSSDPTPGDPDELDRVLTSQYTLIELARTIDSGLAEVSDKASLAFKGKTADAMRGKIDGRIRGFVTTFKTAHEDVRTALTTYVGVMREQQRVAGDALTAAQALPEDDQAGRDAHKSTAETAGQTLETAASTAATALATASESISSPVDECEDLWKALTWIAIILIIPAIIVGGPLALLALGLNLAIMIKTAIDFSRGDASLTELLLSIVGVLAPTTKGLNVGQAWKTIKGFGAQGLKGGKSLVLGGPNSLGLFGRLTLGFDNTFTATGSWLKGGLGDAIKFNQVKGLQGVHILGGGSGKGFQFFPLGVQLGMINNIGAKSFFGLHSLIVGLNGVKMGAGAIANGLSGFKGLRLFLPVAADEMGQGLFLAFKIGFIDRGIFGMYRYGAFVNGAFIGAGSKISGAGAGAFNFFDAGNGGGLGLVKFNDFHFAPGTFGNIGGPGGLAAPGSLVPPGQFAMPPAGVSLSMPQDISVHLGAQGGFNSLGQINLPSIDARLTDLPSLGLNGGNQSLPTLGAVTQINMPGGLGALPNLGSVTQTMPALGQVNIPNLGNSLGHMPSVTLDTPSVTGNLGGLGSITVTSPSMPQLGHISVPSLGTAGGGHLGLIRTELPGINAQIVDLPSVGGAGHLGSVQLGSVQLGHVSVPSLGLSMPHFSVANATPTVGDLASPNLTPALSDVSLPHGQTHLGQIDLPQTTTGAVNTDLSNLTPHLGHTALTNLNPTLGQVQTPTLAPGLGQVDLPVAHTGAVNLPGLGQNNLSLSVPPPATTHLTAGAIAAPGINGRMVDLPNVLPGNGQLLGAPNSAPVLNGSAFSPPTGQFLGDLLAAMNREPLTVFMAPQITYNFQHTFTQLPNMPAGVQVQVHPGTGGQLVNVQVTTPAGMQGAVTAVHVPVNGQDVLRVQHTRLDGSIQSLDYELSAANNHQLLSSRTISPAHVSVNGIQMQTFGPNGVVAPTPTGNLAGSSSGSGSAGAGAGVLTPAPFTSVVHGVALPGLHGTTTIIRSGPAGSIASVGVLPGGAPVTIQHLPGAGAGGIDIARVEHTVTAGAEIRRWEFTVDQAGHHLVTNERRFLLNDGALSGGVISVDLVPAVHTVRYLDANGAVGATGGRPIHIDAASLNIPSAGGFHLYDPTTGLQTHTGLTLVGANGQPTALHVLTPHAPAAGGAVPALRLTGADGVTQLGTVTVPAHAGGLFHVRPTPAPGTAAVPHLDVHRPDGTFSHQALPVPAVHLGGGSGPAFVRLADNAGGLPGIVRADGTQVPGAQVHPQGAHGALGFRIDHNNQHLVVDPAGAHTHHVVALQGGPGAPAAGRFVFNPVATPQVPLPQLRDQNGAFGAVGQVARVDGTYHVSLGQNRFSVHTQAGAYSHQALGVGGLTVVPPGGGFLRADPAHPGGSLLVRGDGTVVPGAVVHPQGNGGFRIDHNNQHLVVDAAGVHTHRVVTLSGPGVPAAGLHVFNPVATPTVPAPHPRAGNGAVDNTVTVQHVGNEFRLTDAHGAIRSFDHTTGALIRTDVPVSGGSALDGSFVRTDVAGAVTVVRADFSVLPGVHATPQTGLQGGGFRLDQGNTHLVVDARGARTHTAVELRGAGAAGGTGHYVFRPTAPGAVPHPQVKDGNGTDLPDTVVVRPDGTLQVTTAHSIRVFDPTDGRFDFSLLRLTDAAGAHVPETVRVYGAGGIRLLDHRQNVIDTTVVTVRPGGGFRVEDPTGAFKLFGATGQLDFHVAPVAGAANNGFTVTPTVGNAFTVVPLGDAVKLTDASLSRFVDITPGGARVLDGNLTVVPGHTVTPTAGGGWRVDPPGNLRLGEYTEYAADGTLTVQRVNVVTKGLVKANNHLELYHVATPGAGGNPAGTWKLVRTDGAGAAVAGVGGKWFQNGLINTKGLGQGRIHLTTHSGVTVFESRPLPGGSNTLRSFQSSASADVSTFSMGNQRGEWHEIDPQGQLVRNGDRHWGESGRSWYDSTGTGGVDRVLHFQQLPDGGHVLGTLNRNVFTQSAGNGVWFRFDADFKMIAQGSRTYGPGLGRGFTDSMHHPLGGQSIVVHEKFGRFQTNTHDVRRLFQREMGADGVPKDTSVSLSAPGKEIDSLRQLENNGGFLEVQRVAEQRPPNWFRHLISSEYRSTDLGAFSWLKADNLPQLNEWRVRPTPGGAAGSHGVRLLTQNAAITDISSTGQLVREMRKLFHGNDLTVGNVKVPDGPTGAPVNVPAQYLPWSEGVGKPAGHRTFNNADFQAQPGAGINVNQVVWHDRFTTNLGDGDWFSPNAAKQWQITRTGLNDGTVIEYRPHPAIRPDGAAGNGDLAFRQNFHMNNGDWTRYDHHGYVVARSDTWPGVQGSPDLRITAHGPSTGKMTWVDANNPHINGVRLTAHGRDINHYGWDRESYQDFGLDGRMIREHRLLGDGTTVDSWRVGRDGAGNETWHWNKIDAHGTIKVFGNGAGDQVRHWIDAGGNALPGWAKGARWSDQVTSLGNMRVQEIPARPDAGAFQNLLGDKPFRIREFVADPGGNFNAHVWKEFDTGAVVRQKKELLNGTFLESESWQKHWRLYGAGGTNVIAERAVSGWVYESNAFGQLKLVGRETNFIDWANQYRGYNRMWKDANRWEFGASVGGESVYRPFVTKAMQQIALDAGHEFVVDFALSLTVLGIAALVTGAKFTATDVAKAAFGAMMASVVKSFVSSLHHAAGRGTPWKNGWGHVDYGYAYQRHPSDDDWGGEWAGHDKVTRWRGGTYDFGVGVATGVLGGFASGAASASVFGVKTASGELIHLAKADAAMAGLMSAVGGTIGGLTIGAARSLVHLNLAGRWYHRAGMVDIYVAPAIGKLIDKSFSAFFMGGAVRGWFNPSWYTAVPVGGAGNSTLVTNATDIPGPRSGYASLFEFDLDSLPQGAGTP